MLGGVAHPGPKKPIDLSQLRRSMGIQPATPEIKFDMVAKGDFLKILSSKKLNIFLTWLVDEAYLIHFIALDPVYYSYVDIVDSMPQVDMFDLGGRYILKRDLYRVLRRDLEATQVILRRYSYPALASGNVRGLRIVRFELRDRQLPLIPDDLRAAIDEARLSLPPAQQPAVDAASKAQDDIALRLRRLAAIQSKGESR